MFKDYFLRSQYNGVFGIHFFLIGVRKTSIKSYMCIIFKTIICLFLYLIFISIEKHGAQHKTDVNCCF